MPSSLQNGLVERFQGELCRIWGLWKRNLGLATEDAPDLPAERSAHGAVVFKRTSWAAGMVADSPVHTEKQVFCCQRGRREAEFPDFRPDDVTKMGVPMATERD